MSTDRWFPWLVFALIVGGVGIFLWFVSTHTCRQSHTEQRMSCTSVGFGNDVHVTSTDCRPYTATVCDEWVRK